MTQRALTIMEHHRLAMELCDKGDEQERKGNHGIALEYFCNALVHEEFAANKFLHHYELCFEPTRSVLYRSAGSIALNCGKKDKAKMLFGIGLNSNNVQPEIADEIRELLKECE